MANTDDGAVFVGQVYDIRTKKDGGGRIAIDFGHDGLAEIQRIQALASRTGCAFSIAMVPIAPSSVSRGSREEFEIDQNGEIIL